ncbi:MAG: alpha/beta hydrolase-fold protein [Anaerolineales bacterium]
MNWKTNLAAGTLRLHWLGLLVLAACGPAATPAAVAAVSPTAARVVVSSPAELQALVDEIIAAPPAQAQAQADALWQTLVAGGRQPLILGQQVTFFYKGAAEQVQWRGTFNGWEAPGLEGASIGQTDLWMAQLELPSASRAEYKIVLNDRDWLPDPANPLLLPSGLSGNSVVSMPGFVVSDESQERSDVTPGKVSGDLSITSRHLGYVVNYRVYTPAGYASLDHLPVLYVLDGNDFVDERKGAIPILLDNLIGAGRIQPVLAVFADAREPGKPDHNRREAEFVTYPVEHARFIAEELVPAIDAAYLTDPRAEARVIMGSSLGGLSAYFIGAAQSGVFHNVASLSPSLWVVDNVAYLPYPQLVGGALQMVGPLQSLTDCGSDSGRACPPLPLKLFFTAGIPDWDVGDFTSQVAALRQKGYPVAYNQVREGHTWGHWRGQADEMLTYFFAWK